MQASSALGSSAGCPRRVCLSARQRAAAPRAPPVLRAVQSAEAAAGAAAAGPRPSSRGLELHMGETVLSIPFTRENGTQLQAAFTTLLQTFATKAKAERPKRWDTMDFKLDAQSEGSSVEALEIFCNPNAYDNHINAKLLITLRHAGIKLSTEAKLHAIKADVDAFLQQ